MLGTQARSGDRDPLAARCGGEERLQKSLEAKAARVKQVRVVVQELMLSVVLQWLGTLPLIVASHVQYDVVWVFTQRQQDMCTFRAQQGSWLNSVPEAPTLYPTLEEFADPLEYIKRVAGDVAAQYGMFWGLCVWHKV